MKKKENPYYQAQDMLSRRDHSEFEIRTKLKKKGFTASDIDTVIDWLKDKKYLNDKRMAQRYVEYAMQTKRVGPQWIRAKLREKGIAADLMQEVIAEAYGENREGEVIQAAVESWKRQHPNKKDGTQRLTRYLQGRGFSFSRIMAAVKGSDDDF